MDGLLLIDKPRGPSSFDVVRRVRKVANMKRVGHTGTLDPDASGVLGVALGRCTKLAQFLVLDEKEYAFDIIFGKQTDSDDATGEVIREASAADITRTRLEAALEDFIGPLQQVPPHFSAIHVNGVRAYELARKGIEFDLPAREIVVHSLECVEFDDAAKVASMVVRCGSGTYVRSIARDLGWALESVAHARGICRTAVGPFRIESAIKLDELDESSLADGLMSPGEMVRSLPFLALSEPECFAIGLGQRVDVALERLSQDLSEDDIGSVGAVYDDVGNLVAVVTFEWIEGTQVRLKPKKVLRPATGPGSGG